MRTFRRSTHAQLKNTALGSGESVEKSLDVTGADRLSGIAVRASTSYDLLVDWEDGQGNAVVTETLASGVAGGTQAAFDVPARSRYATLRVEDAGSGSGAVDLTAHLR